MARDLAGASLLTTFHPDRPLQHVKAKGRPVSQCNHCRSERKNRSAHVKCQCGKRASEGGSGTSLYLRDGVIPHHQLTGYKDCGCFSGGKCRCATKKSPKLEPQQLGAVSELASPLSTATTASPSQIPLPADFSWSEAATPASNFTSLDELSQFGAEPWINNPHLDPLGGFGEHGLVQGLSESNIATFPEANANIMAPDYQHSNFQSDIPGFTNVNDWPSMDDESTKQILAMMDSTTGIDLTSFDPNTLHFGGDLNAGMGLSAPTQVPTTEAAPTESSKASNCASKPEKECGSCCS